MLPVILTWNHCKIKPQINNNKVLKKDKNNKCCRKKSILVVMLNGYQLIVSCRLLVQFFTKKHNQGKTLALISPTALLNYPCSPSIAKAQLISFILVPGNRNHALWLAERSLYTRSAASLSLTQQICWSSWNEIQDILTSKDCWNLYLQSAP